MRPVTDNVFDELSFTEILALISAASVTRREEFLRALLGYSKLKNYNVSQIYEAILQTYLFAGFPSALISLKILSEYFGTQKAADNETNKIDFGFTEDFHGKGTLTCKLIYGDKFEKLIKNVAAFSPEMSNWLVTEGYGKVLSRLDLGLRERELCIVSILSALQFEDQLYSHINGAYRTGADIKQIKKIINNLRLLGMHEPAELGLNVLERFAEQKRVDAF